MLRLLIGTGVLLMAVGFGAAGWQYWQSLPNSATVEPVAAADAGPAPVRQNWLISPTGGLVRQDEVRAYLAQDRFAPDRVVRMQRQANLADLLAEGEKLPEPAFLQVLADIRAPKVAEKLCPVLQKTLVQDCAVQSARVVEGSVDLVQGTALFQIELVFRLKDEGAELPDLAAHVLRSDTVRLDLEAGAEGTASPEAALLAMLATVAEACASDAVGKICRPMQLSLDWKPGEPVSARAGIAWLDPLPKGMFVAPPLGAP
ncbi:hypothetical protein [Tabrizicola sp.]|uniref:hypothetical protein n=1 Tax=Tabrizicola sp. TaxID=2005166 RepID=UPI002734086C|nr:hypothetical protein [Tabrizicola sp.]MDP3194768.1 hypothetical protein [Tabrizicola sp.]